MKLHRNANVHTQWYDKALAPSTHTGRHPAPTPWQAPDYGVQHRHYPLRPPESESFKKSSYSLIKHFNFQKVSNIQKCVDTKMFNLLVQNLKLNIQTEVAK